MTQKIVTIAAAAAVAVASFSVEPFVAPAGAQDTFMGESFGCDSADSDVGRAINNSQPPSSAGTVVQLENLMWILETAIDYFDANCSGEEGYSEMRASLHRSLAATKNACNGLSSNGYCSPRRYR